MDISEVKKTTLAELNARYDLAKQEGRRQFLKVFSGIEDDVSDEDLLMAATDDLIRKMLNNLMVNVSQRDFLLAELNGILMGERPCDNRK